MLQGSVRKGRGVSVSGWYQSWRRGTGLCSHRIVPVCRQRGGVVSERLVRALVQTLLLLIVWLVYNIHNTVCVQ